MFEPMFIMPDAGIWLAVSGVLIELADRHWPISLVPLPVPASLQLHNAHRL